VYLDAHATSIEEASLIIDTHIMTIVFSVLYASFALNVFSVLVSVTLTLVPSRFFIRRLMQISSAVLVLTVVGLASKYLGL
jgi:hypothetical protein